jgi:hypothetical protein
MERFCFAMSVKGLLLLILGGIMILINMPFVLLFNSTASNYRGSLESCEIMLMNQGGR